MANSKITSKTIKLSNGDEVDLKYWSGSDSTKNEFFAAGFNKIGEQITVAMYQAHVDIADGISAAFNQSLVDNLVSIIENDLKSNPELHLKKCV